MGIEGKVKDKPASRKNKSKKDEKKKQDSKTKKDGKDDKDEKGSKDPSSGAVVPTPPGAVPEGKRVPPLPRGKPRTLPDAANRREVEKRMLERGRPGKDDEATEDEAGGD